MKKFLMLMLPMLVLWSCSDDDKVPADANDNFITELSLTVADGTTYDAVIAEDVITMTVPYTVTLDGAIASMVYTPSATIYPNPKEITNWDEERVFRVVSYNGEERKYTYRVVKDEIREEGDVTLKTSADIAAFAAKGTSVINGNLTIGTIDGEEITSFSALENLKEVSGIITIHDSYKGTDLTGLDNVKSIGGINIGSSESFSNTPLDYFSLNSIEEVKSDINIYANSLKYVDFKNLHNIGGSINIASANLISITADKLTDITRDFIVSCKNGNVSGGTIKDFTLPALEHIGGTLSGSDFADLESIYFPKLQSSGSIIFESLPFSVSKIDFPEITEINGDLTFNSYTTFQVIGGVTTGNTNITKFEGFSKLRNLNGLMTITAFTEATNIPDISNATIGGIVLERMMKLTTLNMSNTQFSRPSDETDCNVKFQWMPIKEIIGAKSMDCNFIFENCELGEYEGLPSFENIETIKGLYVGEPSTANFENFVLSTTITEIKDYLQIDLGTFSFDVKVDFPNLKSIGGYAYISHVPDDGMFNISLPNLTTVGGQLFIGGYGINECNMSSLKEVSNQTTSTKLAVDVLFDMEKDFEMGYGLNLCFRRGTEISLPAAEEIGGNGMKINLLYSKIMAFKCPQLNTVAKELSLTGSSSIKLTDMDFPSLTSVPKVSITSFKNLVDFSTFAPLFINGQISEESNWTVLKCAYNPTWQDMKDGKYKPEE